MRWPALDLDAMRKAALHTTNRQLSRHLLDTLGPSLAKLHTTAERVPLLIATASELLAHDPGNLDTHYSLLLLPHLLLGLGWWNDPGCHALHPLTQACSLTRQERSRLLAEHAITHRQRLERILPSMHELTLALMRDLEPDKGNDPRWLSIARLMSLRGIAADRHYDSYCLFEADACKRYTLPAITHKQLNGNETMAYRHYGMRIPQPSDDLKRLERLPRHRVLQHILLALTFGRYFHFNPLFTPWVCALDDLECPREAIRLLTEQLGTHQRALTEELADA